ncbi:hypothetical protein [Variovorax paradoxus]|uniref:hypothetical protein n=1 Tax=Variovorax paradoxus TaxID=34073 RepID=UPI0024814026|nr:hypothetical protein [Variovorax paradoxus]WGT64769.1 hypothetical protein QHG62_05360 [Variovorax paradoxus]
MREPKNNQAPGIAFDAGVSGDRYQGKPDALIAAGVITADHIPTNTSQTFVDGVKVDGRRFKGKHDDRWMQVSRHATSLIVTKGIADAERARRVEARRQAVEELARATPKKDPGFDAVRAMDYKASAALLPGAEVFANGRAATVTGEFKLRRVSVEDGEFVDGDNRTEYIPGYTCRIHESGKEFFYPAHEVRAKSGALSHLRLVSGAGARREIGFSIRSLA